MTPAQPTPEFLVWALELHCPLRDIPDWEQPERTERQLRGARAVSDAEIAGHTLDGICLAQQPGDLAIPAHAAASVDASLSQDVRRQLPMAFAADDALALYGGRETVAVHCTSCPANAERLADSRTWAGCYGILPLPDSRSAFLAAFEEAIDTLGLRSRFSELFPVASPAWYGIWLASPVRGERAELLEPLFTEVVHRFPEMPAIAALGRALTTSNTHNLPLHGELFPTGVVEGKWWRQTPHCPRCRATWPAWLTRCSICGWTGKTGTPQKRRSRGTRPYRPIAEVLGSEMGAEFVERFRRERSINGVG